MTKVRVLLVDDHAMFREALRSMLERDERIEVLAEASTGEESLVMAARLRPNVVIMDILMPGMDGIEATRLLKRTHPEVEVLMLTSYEEEFLEQAVEAGATGYILKTASQKELADAVCAVHEGESPIDPSLSRKLFLQFGQISSRQRAQYLTDRQLEILQLVAAGVDRRGIAQQVFISETTVNREMRNTFNRLGVNDAAHAVAEANRRRLL